jgi:phosphoglycolate phosphatase
MKNGPVRAFVFDLDGTLIDSKLDLAKSVNEMLRELGRPVLDAELVASYVGHGAPQLIASALGAASTEKERREGLAMFLKHYEQHKLDNTRAYPEVVEGLRMLEGTPMAVLSNKPAKMSREILEGLGLVHYFGGVYGGDSFEKKKPDPVGALATLKELGARPEEAAMVGDSDVDVQTARNAGMLAVAVTYGFRSTIRRTISRMFMWGVLRNWRERRKLDVRGWRLEASGAGGPKDSTRCKG